MCFQMRSACLWSSRSQRPSVQSRCNSSNMRCFHSRYRRKVRVRSTRTSGCSSHRRWLDVLRSQFALLQWVCHTHAVRRVRNSHSDEAEFQRLDWTPPTEQLNGPPPGRSERCCLARFIWGSRHESSPKITCHFIRSSVSVCVRMTKAHILCSCNHSPCGWVIQSSRCQSSQNSLVYSSYTASPVSVSNFICET